MEESLDRKCSRCKKVKNIDEFTEPNKLCNTCIADKKEYHQHKKNGTERVKEPKLKLEQKMHFCEVCNYEIKLRKKNQHEGTNYHLDRLERKEHPEKFEDEENPDSKSIIDSKEYVHCYKCKLVILSSNWKTVV